MNLRRRLIAVLFFSNCSTLLTLCLIDLDGEFGKQKSCCIVVSLTLTEVYFNPVKPFQQKKSQDKFITKVTLYIKGIIRHKN